MTREAAEEDWYRALRERFVSVARGRVPESVVEDVVQDAIRIVHARGISSATEQVDGRPRLAWCYQVLRNVIGNYYLKNRKRIRLLEAKDPVTAGAVPTPAESYERGELGRLIREALALLSQEDGSCSRYLNSIAEGMKMGELARREDVEAGILYRRVYRCRARFRKILRELGVSL